MCFFGHTSILYTKLRINFIQQVITRNEKGIRGVLHATLVAFDKQWNLALSDVLEIWKRKAPKKRKIPPELGEFSVKIIIV